MSTNYLKNTLKSTKCTWTKTHLYWSKFFYLTLSALFDEFFKGEIITNQNKIL